MANSPFLLAQSFGSLLPSAAEASSAAPSPAASVSAPVPTPTDIPLAPSLDQLKDALQNACGDQPGVLCRTVYDITHSQYLAGGANVFVGTPLKIVLILVAAFLIRSLLHRFIVRTTRRASSGNSGGLLRSGRTMLLGAFGDPAVLLERRRQRAETVGSLLRSVTSIIVFGIAFVTILGELDINLAPIVASAGIVGVAVGFGAQNLVRDFLAGMFMLLEDQYGVGDVIDVGPVSGNVEAVSLRVTRLRDVEGTVWYVRNGEIARVGNKGQQWARTVLDVPLDYDTDVATAKRILKRTADKLWTDPRFAAAILEEPEVWGMETMTADGYTLRVIVKTQPLKQWDIARALRERFRAALDAEGIELGSVQRSEVVMIDDDEEKRPGADEEEDGGADPRAAANVTDSGPIAELPRPARSPVGRSSGPASGSS
ncbi:MULTISPECIES: mechanosensitive ion channel family protein [Protofrankia]|uniref:Mechanosensitive ion channel protein MscS n=1 Tax=Protofrankia coriariae TaxID=1562887 RepID=A0ABR5F4H0_9ACTN|nr:MULTISPECIES: mechanosensitive ion channel family protein [Protofrankia]KLL11538.1 mechanosensitive ion channel protein MscS [Protofrankia coriariae]ONH35668.1 mechanosensitive ion channel protein MscS [Protofrankia sp. BMG5.30]